MQEILHYLASLNYSKSYYWEVLREVQVFLHPQQFLQTNHVKSLAFPKLAYNLQWGVTESTCPFEEGLLSGSLLGWWKVLLSAGNT